MASLTRLSIAASLLLGSVCLASAAGMTPDQMAAARAKVQTAVALAKIARETKDGDAMLVAARLLSSSGDVAMSDEKSGTPAMYDVKTMAMEAKEMGADPKKAEELMTAPTSKMSGAVKPTGYWINTCDASGYCAWAWIDG